MTQVLMEECVIIGQGQECSMDRFSPTKRALNVPGMAEPRGAGGQILSADLLTHHNQGGRLGPLHYYCVFTLQIFRPSAIPVYTESRIYLWNSVFWNRLEKRWRDNWKFLCFFYILMDYRIISYHPKVVEGTNFIVVHWLIYLIASVTFLDIQKNRFCRSILLLSKILQKLITSKFVSPYSTRYKPNM